MFNNVALKMYLKFKMFMQDNKGQAMTEYGLLIAIIAVAVITVLTGLSDKLVEVFKKISDALTLETTP